MAREKYNQITNEPMSLTVMRNYACFFSGLPSPVTPKDVAVMLDVKTETVKRWLKRGDLERLDITSLKAFMNTKPEYLQATYAARMALFSAFINEAVEQISGTLAFSMFLVNTVEQLNDLRKLAALPSAGAPTETLAYEELLSIYGVTIQFPYDVVNAYTKRTCDPDKIFISGRYQEPTLDIIKNGGTPFAARRGAYCLEELERLETQYNRDGYVTIEFTMYANPPINEGTSLDKKHKDLEVDDG